MLLTSPLLDDFVAAAREFCTLAEQDDALTEADLWKVRLLLLRLICNIPAVDAAPQATDHDGASPDNEKWAKAVKRFAGFPFDVYRVVFDPHDLEADDGPVTSALSDDLGDIYRDLAEGLSNADKGHLEDACFEWSQSYKFHWARHAVNALTAIELYRIDIWKNIDPGTS